jgi:hypothetical protein
MCKLSSQMRWKASPLKGGGTVGVTTLTKKGWKVSANGTMTRDFCRVTSLTRHGFQRKRWLQHCWKLDKEKPTVNELESEKEKACKRQDKKALISSERKMRTKKRKWLLIAASLGCCMHGIADLQTWTWRFISPANAARSASSQRWWHVTLSSSTRESRKRSKNRPKHLAPSTI